VGRVCAHGRWSGASLVNPFLNYCSRGTGNKDHTLFFLLQIQLKEVFPVFLQIWMGGGVVFMYFSSVSAFMKKYQLGSDG